MMEKLMAKDAPEIARSVISAAKGGDMVAARLVLERLCPVRKGRPVAIDLPPLDTVDDVAEAVASIAGAMASGDLTPDEAATAAGVVEVKRRALETVELERRVAALEAKDGTRQ
jgi:hypothetical protein